MDAVITIPTPANEPVRQYEPGTAQRASLEKTLADLASQQLEIPAIIGGERVKTDRPDYSRMPHNHQHKLATFYKCGEDETKRAIKAAHDAHGAWSRMPFHERAAIFLRAADLLAGPWRDRVNASTMLGQSKTVFQAEIDAVCELIDFWRFNCKFAEQIYQEQPVSVPGMWNQLDHRPLEGFVFAVSPFNFTSISINLPSAPALMGNTVIWKPSNTQVYSAWFTMQLLEEAGLPPGVINFLPGDGADVGDPCLNHPDLAGIHFTGSTKTFQHLWQSVGKNIANYRSYPRIVGETGGKDFVLAHQSADAKAVATALVRGAFEYQGQKCSAASRAFIPDSLWDDVTAELERQIKSISMGDPSDLSHFMAAVIDERSFQKIKGYIQHAQEAEDHNVLFGGNCDDSQGYFVEPTVVVADRPDAKLMVEEIFGPVLTMVRYPDDQLEETMNAIDAATQYALTGAIFAKDRQAIGHMTEQLRFAAGNFYINDKPTGAVVGQQPFGGGRASGTNDKAGSILNLQRWVSPRAIKETFVSATDYRYPHQG